MSFKAFHFFFVVAVCMVVFGCGSRKHVVETYSVSGIVTLDGQPAVDVFVSFAMKLGPPITVRTDESGRYNLQISQALNACIPGSATVSIEAFKKEDDPRSQYLPKKYNAGASQNPAMCVDVSRGDNTFNFDLLSK